jgi:hypothetical protein
MIHQISSDLHHIERFDNMMTAARDLFIAYFGPSLAAAASNK